jgi:hypothetical protein
VLDILEVSKMPRSGREALEVHLGGGTASLFVRPRSRARARPRCVRLAGGASVDLARASGLVAYEVPVPLWERPGKAAASC